MNSQRSLVVLTALLLLGAADRARADMGLPGFKRIPHHAIFDNLGDYPEFTFFLAPVRTLEPDEDGKSLRDRGYPARLRAGESYALGDVRFQYDWVLLAAPSRLVEEGDGRIEWNSGRGVAPGFLRSDTFRFPDFDDELVGSPTECKLHHFRIRIEGDQLSAMRTGIESVSNPVVVWSWVAVGGSATLAGLGIWWVRRRARAENKKGKCKREQLE